MRQGVGPFRKIGLAKENESPENPGALEKRTALIPSDVAKLVDFGCQVFVEKGTGEGVGFSDEAYLEAGAEVQSEDQIYRGKDLVVKFKGPSLGAIDKMDPFSTLFCMAHFHSFPDRARLLQKKKINVIAMEKVVESPKILSDEIILSKKAASELFLKRGNRGDGVRFTFLGYSDRLVGGIRRAGNRDPDHLEVVRSDVSIEELKFFGPDSIYFYDSTEGEEGVEAKDTRVRSQLLGALKEKDCELFDLAAFEREKGKSVIKDYREAHPPFDCGLRRIQCLHETGRAGARYGIHLLKNESRKIENIQKANVLVFGYGNVGMGAIHECYSQGIQKIQVLSRRNTRKDRIERFLKDADLIINGAEQPVEVRGKNFLLTKTHVREQLKPGTVVIDLVGGSSSNRSAIENVIQCTFLNNPHFVEDGVYFSALWGWPMMGMMRETAIRYSGQIVDVLLGRENLISGIHGELHPGVQPALVCRAS